MNTDERIRRLIRDIGELAPLTDEIPTPRLHATPAAGDVPDEWRDRGRHRAVLAMTCVVLLAGGLTLWWLDRQEAPQNWGTLADDLPVTATADDPTRPPAPDNANAGLALGPPVERSTAELSCDRIERAVSEVYGDTYSVRPEPATYVEEFKPEVVGEDERWCEFSAPAEEVSRGVPGVTVVVIEGPSVEPVEDTISRIASSQFSDITLSLSGLDRRELPVGGEVEIPGDSPGHYGAAGNELEDGSLLVVVTDSSEGSAIPHRRLADLLAERILADTVAAPPVGESLEGLSPDGWVYPGYLPEGLELAYAAVTIPDAQRMLVFHDPSEPRNSGRSVAVTFTAGEPIAWTDLVPVDLATGDTWESRPGGFLRFVLDGGSVEVLGAGLATREVEDVAASLTTIDAIDLPRPVIDLFEDELVTVAETTVDGRIRIMQATSDGVAYGWAIGNDLFRGGSSSCCSRLRPGESIVVTGAQGPDPQRLEADGVADFLIEGLLSPEVAEVRIETDDGFTATVPAQELSGTFGVRFLLAAIPIADGAVVTGTATALDATGAELGVAGFEMRGE